MELLYELDQQQHLVDNLTERGARERDAFSAFSNFLNYETPLQVEGEIVVIDGKRIALSVFDVLTILEHKREMRHALARLKELKTRAQGLGIKIV